MARCAQAASEKKQLLEIAQSWHRSCSPKLIRERNAPDWKNATLNNEFNLPEYAGALLAFHRSHEQTLKTIIEALPIRAGNRVVDVATGDGTYALHMALRGAHVTAVDLDNNYLEFARRAAQEQGIALDFVQAAAQNLPFETQSLDGAFCAQSFYTIDDVDSVMAEMKRVVRPGGWVGVMENDSLHHVILPWPPELELQLLGAEHRALEREETNQERYYIGRRLGAVLRQCGLVDIKNASFATQRSAPLSDDEQAFLQNQVSQLVKRATPYLDGRAQAWAQTLSDPDSKDYLLGAPSFSATILDFLVWGQVP